MLYNSVCLSLILTTKEGVITMTKKNWKKRLVSFVLGIGCIAMLGAGAMAATYTQGFMVDVPRLNGSANTSTQRKDYQGRSGYIWFDAVGGGKKVDCRMRDSADGTEGSWLKNMTTGSDGSLYSRASHAAGDYVCVRISNKLTTIVAVTCSGDWRAD